MALSASGTTHAARASAPAAARVPASTRSAPNVAAELTTAPAAISGRVIVVLEDQHSNLNLLKQNKLRRALAFRDHAPIVASIEAHGGTHVLQLVAVNAVAAQLSKAEVSQLTTMPWVAKIVPDTLLGNETSAALSPAASVPAAQVQPPSTPAPCPATATSPTGVTNVAEEGERGGQRLGRQPQRSRHGQLGPHGHL